MFNSMHNAGSSGGVTEERTYEIANQISDYYVGAVAEYKYGHAAQNVGWGVELGGTGAVYAQYIDGTANEIVIDVQNLKVSAAGALLQLSILDGLSETVAAIGDYISCVHGRSDASYSHSDYGVVAAPINGSDTLHGTIRIRRRNNPGGGSSFAIETALFSAADAVILQSVGVSPTINLSYPAFDEENNWQGPPMFTIKLALSAGTFVPGVQLEIWWRR